MIEDDEQRRIKESDKDRQKGRALELTPRMEKEKEYTDEDESESGSERNRKTSSADLSKILGGQSKIWGAKGGKSDKYVGVPQLLGHVPWLPQSLRL